MPGNFRKKEVLNQTVIVTHIVDDSHSGWRADRYLKSQYRSLSRMKLQGLIEQGLVEFLGHTHKRNRIKASTVLLPGDILRVSSDQNGEEPTVNLDYKILYEDDYLLAIDKPPNLPVHPAGRYLFNSLLMQLRKQRPDWVGCDRNDEAGPRGFYIIHRLDRETSGVLLVAKRQTMARSLVRQFFERKTQKRYYAIIHGHVKQTQFDVDLEIGPDPNSTIRLKMAAFSKGSGNQEALTRFYFCKRGRNTDLLDCELLTGRQHQIRVHLSSIGHPIVGDKLYGCHGSRNPDRVFLNYLRHRDQQGEFVHDLGHSRQALHSRYVRFFHEPLNRWMEIESPLPEDLANLLGKR